MKRLSASLLALLVLGTAQGRAQTDETVLLDRIVAVVNEGVVLQSELEEEARQVAAALMAGKTPLPPKDIFEQQVLERLILQRIQLQRADQIGIRVDDDSLNRALAAVARRNDLSLSELPAALASQGVNYEAYRQQMRTEMALERLRARDVLARIYISEEEIESQLTRVAEQDSNVEYNISHILVSVPTNASSEKLAEARDQARKLYERLQAGEDFGQLAVAYSGGAQALQGGDLGWLSLAAVPTLFVEPVTRMSPGEVSQPLASPSGFHIIKLKDTRGVRKVVVRQRHVRHILIQPNEVITEEAARAKLQRLRERILAGESFAELAREESHDTATKADGGDLGWSNPDTFTESFEQIVRNLDDGELSQPVKTEFGWHLIEKLGERDYDSTEEVKRSLAISQLRRKKLESESESWLRRLRDEAYVEIRL